MKRKMASIIFWGAIWGITEATAGYLLHMLPIQYGWAVWFPLAFFFMRSVRNATGSNESVLLTAVIAAAVKFVNILMPGSVDRVLNPAASILIEAFSFYLLYKLVLRGNKAALAEYSGILAASFAWRIIYLGYVSLLPGWMVQISPVASIPATMEFLVSQSLINGVSVIAILGLCRFIRAKRSIHHQPVPALNKLPASASMGAARLFREALPYCLLLASLAVTRFI